MNSLGTKPFKVSLILKWLVNNATGAGNTGTSFFYVSIFVAMISEKDLAELEGIPYEERIARVEKLLENKAEPRPFELGLLLALKMGQELREGKELGSESGDLVASWVKKYPEYTVEEAIASAKEFLVNPSKLAERIKSGVQKKNAEEADAKAFAASKAAEEAAAKKAAEEETRRRDTQSYEGSSPDVLNG